MHGVTAELRHGEHDLRPLPLWEHRGGHVHSLACHGAADEGRHCHRGRGGLLAFHPDADALTGVDLRGEHGIIALLVEIRAREHRLKREIDRSGALAVGHKLGAVYAGVRLSRNDAQRVLRLIRQLEPVRRAGERKVHTQLARLRADDILRQRAAVHPAGERAELLCLVGKIDEIEIAGYARERDKIVDRTAIALRYAAETAEHTEDRADAARVAVGIVAAHDGDLDAAAKLALAVKHGEDTDPGVRNDMVSAGIFFVAELARDHLAAGAEIRFRRVCAVVGAHRLDHAAVVALLRQEAQTGIQHLVQRGRRIRRGDARGHKPRAVHAAAAVRYARGCGGEIRGARRVAGADEPPGVHKDLSADLLGGGLPVFLDAAGARRLHAAAEVHIRAVLGGSILAAPPNHTYAAASIVEPCFADHLRRERFGHGVIRKSTDKSQRTIHIVVCSIIPLLAQIAADVAVIALQPFVCPERVFHRRTETHTGVHADESGIKFFERFSFHGI